MLNQISLAIGPRVLYEDVVLKFQAGQRGAVVGANGAGKSTLLSIISGHQEPSSGSVDYPKGTTIGYLKQDHFDYEDELVLNVVIAGRPALADALAEKETLLKVAELTIEQGCRLGELEEIIMNHQGYTAEVDAEKILKGLGIPEEQHILALKELSGGWKLRVLLAQALFSNPDILLLDEPTNHLDIDSIGWLARYLCREFSGLLLFVSHDRSFIDEVATDVLDIDYKTILSYPGNYETFIDMKEEAMVQAGHERKHQEARIEELQNYVRRFGAKASKAKQAKSRLKMIERIDLVDIKQTSRREPYFLFQQENPCGKQVLEVKGVSKAFDRPVLNNIHFELMRGQRCAIVGPNGVGKSTLLKIVLSHLQADSGEFRWNDRADIGYFAQDYRESLDPSATLLSWLTSSVAKTTEQDARSALGKMLFSGDEVNKRIGVLSGGESARLVFAQLMLSKNNILILDEPTNHLDLEAIDGLAAGLVKFDGTSLFVSHNRYFVECVATSLLVVSPRGVDYYEGHYMDYLERMGTDYFES